MAIIINSKFRPFSYDEMLKPVAMVAQEHKDLDEQLGILDLTSSVWEKLKKSDIDRDVYEQYKNYANALKEVSDELALHGLNFSSRRNMLDMRARYAKEITPIELAWTERDRQKKLQQEMMMKDPTHMFGVEAGQVGLSLYMRNDGYDALSQNYSGALLTQQARLISTNLQKVLTDKGALKKLGLPYQYERDVRYGYTKEQIDAAIRGDEGADPVLTHIIDTVLEGSGISKWGNYNEIKDRVRGYIGEGMYDAIGTTTPLNFKDDYGMQDALNANQFRRQKAAEEEARKTTLKDMLPIDIHHLVSPHQEGEKGYKIADNLRKRLGFSGALNGRYATMVDLKGIKLLEKSESISEAIARKSSPSVTGPLETINGGSKVRLFNSKRELLSKASVVNQGKTAADREALRKWYDETYALIRSNLKANDKGHYTVEGLTRQLKGMTQNKGPLTMGAMRLNFGDKNTKVLESLIPTLSNGKDTSIKEIKSFDKNGKITTGSTAKVKDFIGDEGKAKGTPIFYASPNVNTDGLIMLYNGKSYLIPRDKLGSLGSHLYNIDIANLQLANDARTYLVSKYGELAYLYSPEGAELEAKIEQLGGAFVKDAISTLAGSYETPTWK